MESSPSSPCHPHQRYYLFIAVFFIGAIAIALRWPQMKDSLWLDELHTSWCVAGSWSDVIPRARIGNQSPFYFYLLRAAVGIAGLNEIALRSISLVSGLALIAITGFATARWTGSNLLGMFAATLVAVDRNCIFYSQEARPYALLQFIAWCHAFVLWQLTQQVTIRRRVLLVLGAIFLFYLHYTSILVFLAEFVFLLDRMFDRKSRCSYRPTQFLWDVAIVIAAVLPAAGHLLEIHGRRKQWELFVKQLPDFGDFWQLLRLDVYVLPALTLLAAWYLLRLKSESPSNSENAALRRPVSLALTLLLVPAMFAWIATRRQVAALFLTRYLASSLVAAPITTALLIQAIGSKWLRVAAAGFTLASSIWYSGMLQQWQRDGRILGDRRQDWRGAVEFVNQRSAAPGSVCYVRSGFIEAQQLGAPHPPLLDEYCLAPVNNIYKLEMRAVPLVTIYDVTVRADSVSSDGKSETWFLILGRPETWKQFTAHIERQLRPLGLSTAFDEQATFGDVLACRLGRVKGRESRNGQGSRVEGLGPEKGRASREKK